MRMQHSTQIRILRSFSWCFARPRPHMPVLRTQSRMCSLLRVLCWPGVASEFIAAAHLRQQQGALAEQILEVLCCSLLHGFYQICGVPCKCRLRLVRPGSLSVRSYSHSLAPCLLCPVLVPVRLFCVCSIPSDAASQLCCLSFSRMMLCISNAP
jgi:hypothetical protein